MLETGGDWFDLIAETTDDSQVEFSASVDVGGEHVDLELVVDRVEKIDGILKIILREDL